MTCGLPAQGPGWGCDTQAHVSLHPRLVQSQPRGEARPRPAGPAGTGSPRKRSPSGRVEEPGLSDVVERCSHCPRALARATCRSQACSSTQLCPRVAWWERQGWGAILLPGGRGESPEWEDTGCLQAPCCGLCLPHRSCDQQPACGWGRPGSGRLVTHSRLYPAACSGWRGPTGWRSRCQRRL